MGKLGLDRKQLAKFLPNQEAIVAFESIFSFVSVAPTTIEEAKALANDAVALAWTAAAVANQALAMLAGYAEMLEQFGAAPAPSDQVAPDDFTPAFAMPTIGTLGEQDANNVAITGGVIDGTAIGATTPSTGSFTTLAADGAVTFGKLGAAAQISFKRASDGVAVVTDKMVVNDRELDNQAGDTVIRFAGTRRLTVHTAGVSVAGGLTVTGGATLIATSTALANGAAAAAGTLANAPVAGNPSKWIGINDSGTIRYIPAW